MAGPSEHPSDADFALAQRAVERGWLTREQVEAAVVKHDAEPGRRLLDHLNLSPDQVGELLSPPTRHLPEEVTRVYADPAKRVGKYVVVAPLGAGGMGVVVKAYDTVLRRSAALKFLRSVGDDQARAMFDREAQLAGGLLHPHIASIYETGEHGGQPFIAMQFIDGENLSVARKRMSLPQVVDAVREVAEAVRFAHGKGIIHRDLKPSNVMIDRSGHVFVMDFGLAKETALEGRSLTGSGAIVGTPNYMAPEQAKGKADAQSDVYGLGAILYEMVTGRPPFTAETTADVLLQVVDKEPVWPRKLNPAVPRDLEAIILHALEKEKHRRYADVDQLAEDLEAYVSSKPLRHARRPSSAYVLGKSIRRQPFLWMLGAGMLVAIGAAAAVWIAGVRSDQRHLDRILRLADAQRLIDIKGDGEKLWPAVPENEPAMRRWLDDARKLASRLPEHRKQLASFPPPTTKELSWERDLLEKLCLGLEEFAGPRPASAASLSGILDTTIASVEQRLEFARTIRKHSVDDHAAEWAQVPIAPQVGLVPLGKDPQSGLWEFADLQSGEPAVRGTDGKLVLKPESGLVFVLTPAGTFTMGADPRTDPKAQDNERPPHEVAVQSFFLSKYEMTQAQWTRLTGTNPSQLKSKTGPLNPVESVSWTECTEVLQRLGLLLPTEAQWEYAARAGTATPWWTGADEKTLAGAANIADRYYHEHDGDKGIPYQDWLNDGFTWHAPVGTYRPNSFGLHEIVGNVWEWCRDGYAAYESGPRSGDEPRSRGDESRRILRGSGFRGNPMECRSAFRGNDFPETRLVGLGVRPMRKVNASE